MSNDIDRAFQAHITEFNAMRDEINLHIGHQNQLINYAIGIVVGTASLFAFGQPNIAQQEPFLLLVASLLMSGISWSFMEASLQINNQGRYIHEKIVPKIQMLIGNQDKEKYHIMRWEDAKISHPKPRLLLQGITAMGKFSIAYIPSIAFIFIFRSITDLSGRSWTNIETSLYWAAIIAALILPIGGLLNVPFLLRFNVKSLIFWKKKK